MTNTVIDYQAKIKKYRRILKHNPDSIEANGELGKIYVKMGEFSSALSYLEKVLSLNPDLPGIHEVLFDVYRETGDLKNARHCLEKMLKNEPSNIDYLKSLGYLYYTEGLIDKALEAYEEGLKIKPEDFALLNDVGVIYFTKKDENKALEYFQRALEIKEYNLDTYYNLGILYSEKGNIQSAINVFEKLARLEPSNAEIFKRLSALYLQLQKYAEANERLKRFLELKPKDVEGLYWHGLCQYACGEYNSAGESFKKVLQINSEFPAVKNNLAQCYINAGLKEKALELGVLPAEPVLKWETKIAPKFSIRIPIAPMSIISRIDREKHIEKSTEEIQISVVIPIYNEEENISILYPRVLEVLKNLNTTYEIIFVDDGSTDKSQFILRNLSAQDPRTKIVLFRRNYGQTAALAAGFDLASGEIIVTLDGDLQNDPSDIPRLLEKMQEGYDLVSGYREKRQDKLISRKIPSFLANKLIAKLTNVRLRDYGCTLKAYKSGIIKNIKLYGEMHRFIPALASYLGIRVAEIPVKHHPRIHGITKYGINRTYRVILDLINVRFLLDYFTRPIQFFGKLALVTFVMAFLILTAGLAMRYGFRFDINMTIVTLIVAVAILTGVQLIMMGLVGEIVIRTYHEAQNKPIYIIKEIING